MTDQTPGPPQPPGPQYPLQWFHPPQSPYPAHPVPVYAVPSPMQQAPVTNTGPISFAFGMLAFLLGWIPLVGLIGTALGVVGLVLGLKALRLAKIGFISDRGLAIAGVVLSCVGIAIGVVFAAVFVFAMFGG
ncbi:hypothetical protein ACQPZQ_12615 [Pseudonocardia sp. CA-142604]|uniref:hypothetical protein n=1 Tax=Pseudonocardia sp. CA-142604 TaxID=3240024 RepID=UPI003D8B8606